jgi:hypothetical protein
MAALTTAFQAAAGLSGVTVTQGYTPTAAADPEFIIVGHDGSLEADGSLAEFATGGTFTSTFIEQGQPPLSQEDGTVNVVVVSQTGDQGAMAARITEAQRLLSACDDAITDLHSGDVVFDSVGTGRLLTRQTSQGCAAIIAFTITYSSPW